MSTGSIGGGARGIDLATRWPDRAHGEDAVGAVRRDQAGAGHHMRIDLVRAEGEAHGHGAGQFHLLIDQHLVAEALVDHIVQAGAHDGTEGHRRPSVQAALLRIAHQPVYGRVRTVRG